MRLGILDRVRRWARQRGRWPPRPGLAARTKADSPGRVPHPVTQPPAADPAGPEDWDSAAGRHRRSPDEGWPAQDEQPGHTSPRIEPAVRRPVARGSGAGAAAVRSGSAQARVRTEPGVPVPRAAAADVQTVAAQRVAVTGRRDARSGTAWRSAPPALRARLPFTAPHARERPPAADGRRNCGT